MLDRPGQELVDEPAAAEAAPGRRLAVDVLGRRGPDEHGAQATSVVGPRFSAGGGGYAGTVGRPGRAARPVSRHVEGVMRMSLALLFVGTAAAFAAGVAVLVVALARA